MIAILDFDVGPDDGGVALNQLLTEAPDVRAMKGNIAFRPYADPLIGTRVTLVHEWESREDFAAYLASPAFLRSGEKLRPLMAAPPVSRRFEAQLIETLA
ncbi:putative quinol monooxygenase [Silicimonas algicola]|uniref:Quinol monooxygenase YgiN n=1 Tax=Silicimonas algicola TaxID=1826607 RepID=A0A316G2D0_9RHOB|nr:antibiotic biosynthesis monooxygenase [Silicimonas algicola]PWK54056.1 quinol monooxygenase YgiN [Silicimonas algicola]